MTYANNSQESKSVEECIHRQINNRHFRTNFDVVELYLANLQIQSSELLDERRLLSPYRFLRVLWLNNNRLTDIQALFDDSPNLSELYLGNNQIKCIQQSLQHLHSLTILSLENNQISDINAVAYELRNVHRLYRMNLLGNPLTQHPNYFSFLIVCLPSLHVLDHHEVLFQERQIALEKFDKEGSHIKNRVSFWKILPPTKTEKEKSLKSKSKIISNIKTHTDKRIHNEANTDNKNTELEIAEKYEERRLKKSIMEYSRINWGKQISNAKKLECGDDETNQINLNKPETVLEMITLRMQI